MILVDNINGVQQMLQEQFVSGKISNKIKNNFTRVLKGHIAVVTCEFKKNFNGI